MSSELLVRLSGKLIVSCQDYTRVMVKAALRVETGKDLAARRKILREIDAEGVLSTPANSSYNELVIEAGRMSILNAGRPVVIEYGKKPGVKFKAF